MKITSDVLKCAVMSYYRFVRGFVAAEEVFCDYGRADILLDEGSFITEIEIKISKHDLLVKEKQKLKHKYNLKRKINKFYLCVPGYLKEDALKFISDIDERYGLILFNEEKFNKISKPFLIKECLDIEKRAKKLNEIYNEKYKNYIIKRLSSKIINDMQEKIFK